MKAVFKANSLIVGVLLLCTAMVSAGLGLGRAQGVVFVGKPLDVRVQLLLDASEDIQSGKASPSAIPMNTENMMLA